MPEDKAEPKVAEAVGTATVRTRMGANPVESAMADAVRDVQAESEAIWARKDLTLKEKNEKIAAINDPVAMKKRMLEARVSMRAEMSAAGTSMNLKVLAEFERCLADLDADAFRRLHGDVFPHLYQPKNNDEALHTLHLARAQMKSLPLAMREYSEAWLKERTTGIVAHAVGVSVGFPGQPMNARQEDVRGAMSGSAMDSYKAGIDLHDDAPEVKSRMMIARAKIHRFKNAVRGFRIGRLQIGITR